MSSAKRKYFILSVASADGSAPPTFRVFLWKSSAYFTAEQVRREMVGCDDVFGEMPVVADFTGEKFAIYNDDDGASVDIYTVESVTVNGWVFSATEKKVKKTHNIQVYEVEEEDGLLTERDELMYLMQDEFPGFDKYRIGSIDADVEIL